MQRQRGKANTTSNNQTLHPEHHPVERSINKILRPSEAIRNAIQSSMNSHADVHNGIGEASPKILALHPRIEHDMLQHRCSKYMEQNLTKIFGHLRGDISRDVDLFFLAVNVELIFAEPQMNLQSGLRELAVENAMVLNRTRAFGLFGNEDSAGIPMFESGVHTAETVSGLDLLSYLQLGKRLRCIIIPYTTLTHNACLPIKRFSFQQNRPWIIPTWRKLNVSSPRSL